MQNKEKVFIIDDDTTVQESLSQMLKLRGYEVEVFGRAEKVLVCKNLEQAGCFILDIKMPGMSGIDLLQELINRKLPGSVIMITGHGDVSTAVSAIKTGAYDFLEKPFEKEVILAAVARAVEKYQLLMSNERMREELQQAKRQTDNYGLLGNSASMREVLQQIQTYAPITSSLLVIGETGTGKELVARALHNKSPRSKNRFVAVNMSTLSETMVQAELFGYEKGAFTGALESHEGKFEYANHGTLLLDEIDSMPLHLQAMLLRVLEEKTINRLGSNRSIPVDVRILAATNQDILKLVETGKFRRDLYHRLNMVSIYLPPLRERPEDIPLLAAYFLEQCCKFYDREQILLAPSVYLSMQSYAWPGNVRELKNVIESMVLRATSETINEWTPNNRTGTQPNKENNTSLRVAVENFERQYISNVLRQTLGNLKTAAVILDISPRTLFDKMKKLDLEKENFK